MNHLFEIIPTGELSFPGEGVPLLPATSSAAIGLLGKHDFRFRDPSQQQYRSVIPVRRPSVGERLFDAVAATKIWTSKVAMHLDRVTRDRFFKQLDRLHDEDEWIGDDLPVNLESYKGLIRAFISVGIDRGPSLALMPNGNLLAVWQNGPDRLNVEFLSGDRAKWFLSVARDANVERAAGETSIGRIEAVLAPYGPERWLVGS